MRNEYVTKPSVRLVTNETTQSLKKGRLKCAVLVLATGLSFGLDLGLGGPIGGLMSPGVAHAQVTSAGKGTHVLNFRDADLRAFIEDVAIHTGRTFIIDPQVNGKVTVISSEPVDNATIFAMLESTLNINGFTAVPTSSGAYKVVPVEAAARESLPSNAADMRANLSPTGDSFVTEVITLRYIDTTTVQRVVRPLIRKEGQVLASRGSDQLVLVDTAANVARLKQVIRKLDQDKADIRQIVLTNTSASEMAEILNKLTARAGLEDGSTNALSVIPVESSNTLLLKGDGRLISRYAPVVEELDERNASRGAIRVHYLDHAPADKIAPILDQVVNSLSGGGEGEATAARRRATIAVHQETNSLVINADPEVQKTLEGVIAKLDIRRAQVLVEGIIVEVSDTLARNLGLQYVFGGGGGNIPLTATNFPAAPNLLALAGAVELDDDDSDFSSALGDAAVASLLGLTGFTAGFAGETDGGSLFGFILNALDLDTGSNVLSTPSITTLDNEPASILVGSEIPIATGEVLGTANINPFRTVERQDVGVQLEVRPQINKGDVVQLFVRQEVSSVIGPVSATSDDLIISKREVETAVVVDNGEIIVLGGLIEDNEQITINKVPLLGDIPYVGRLFRTEARSKVRTNLMVFLRPTIVRSKEDLRAVTDRKYDYIRAEQILRSRDAESTLEQFNRDILGVTPAELGDGDDNLPTRSRRP